MSSPEISAILEHSKDLDRLRKEQEEVLVEINKLHKKVQASESLYLFNSLTQIIKLLKKIATWGLVFIFSYLGLMGMC